MDKVMRQETEMPTDMLAGLLIRQEAASSAAKQEPERLSAKIYLVMAVTTLLTFATLTTGYELFFTRHLFA